MREPEFDMIDLMLMLIFGLVLLLPIVALIENHYTG